MGRPSLAAERKSQILEALQDCIVENGVEGSTLDLVAERAGLKRTLVLHYFKSRRGLLEELVDRVDEQWAERYAAAEAEASGDRVGVYLDLLFSDLGGRLSIVYEALAVAGRRDAALEERVRLSQVRGLEAYRTVLAEEFSQADADRIAETVHTLFSLSFGNWSLHAAGIGVEQTARVRQVAQRLVDELASPEAG